jgi:hypothetical protein
VSPHAPHGAGNIAAPISAEPRCTALTYARRSMARLSARRTLTSSNGGFFVFIRRFSVTLVDVSVNTIFGFAPFSCSMIATVVSPG